MLIRNVGLKGKNKLADKWNKDVFIVLDQPDPSIPVYRVKRNHGRSTPRTLHRNMLLSITGLPLSDPRPGRIPEIPDKTHDSSSVDVPTIRDSLFHSPSRSTSDDSFVPTSERDRSDPISEKPVTSKEISSVPPKAGNDVIPHRGLNPKASAFVPTQRPQRDRNRPAWMRSTDWLVSPRK